MVDGATRPGYRPVYHPVSALALGSRGWVQTANFVVSGLLITAGAVGTWDATRSWLGPLALAVFSVSLIASGVFRMDPMRGYPAGTPMGTPEDTSRPHALHDAFGAAVFTALPAAALVFAFALPGPGWTIYSLATGIACLVLLFAFSAAWERDEPRTGLIQRATIIVGWSWVALLCLHLSG
nr:DUF998 domain-containing protein [Phytoactinopolyspora alkaliphila]